MDKPTCPRCGGPLETTAYRGHFDSIPRWAICCWIECRAEWMVSRRSDGMLELERYDRNEAAMTDESRGAAR